MVITLVLLGNQAGIGQVLKIALYRGDLQFKIAAHDLYLYSIYVS